MYQTIDNNYNMVFIVSVICFFVFSDIEYSQSDTVRYPPNSLNARAENLLDILQYDPALYPDFPNGTTNVSVWLHFYDLHSISETDMDFTAELFFNLQWIDKRLINLTENMTGEPSELHYFTSTIVQKIWRPNVYFTKEKSATLHAVPQRNEIMYIHRNGTVHYNTRLSVKHACKMKLGLYPFDSQKCKMQIESFSYTEGKVRLFWEHPGVKAPDPHSRHFELFDKGKYSCETDFTPVGNFSSLSFEFILIRQNGYYILSLFTPSGLIVILSWISFLVDPQIVHGRLSLGSVCFLSMISLDASTQNHLPSVSYMKAVDIWMICCQIFVFLALIEFAVVYYRYVFSSKKDLNVAPAVVAPAVVNYGSISKESKGEMTKSQETCLNDKTESMSMSARIDRNTSRKVNENTVGDRNTNTVNVVDKWSRGIFPAAFVAFLTIYAVTFRCLVSERMSDLLGEEDKWLPLKHSHQYHTIPC